MVDMYKSVLAWAEYKEGDKHEPTHKLLSNREYNELIAEINRLRREIAQEKQNSKQEVENIKKSAIAYSQKVDADCKKQLDQVQEVISKANKERDYQISLNENLLRINRERANAKRKLQPKKEHSGYVVRYSQEQEVRYAIKKGTASYSAWETVIQTPYSIDFEEKIAREQITRDLTPNGGQWLLGKIGINQTYYTDLSTVLNDAECRESNVAFSQKLKANFRSGMWEVIFLHTKSLNVVPQEMRKA